jgi:hypothetical protein
MELPPGGAGLTEPGARASLLGQVQDARRRLAAVGPGHVRSAGDFERISIPQPDDDVLRDLLLLERPTKVVEIGLAYGTSALAIAEALVANEGRDAGSLLPPETGCSRRVADTG